jgi:kumamolisin
MSATHTPVPGSRRIPLAGARATARANPHTIIEVTLKLRRRKELPATTDAPEIPLTRDALAEQFGASVADIKAVHDTFAKYGLSLVREDAATRTVVLSGTIQAIEAAFDVRLFHYEHPDGDYRGRVGEYSVPSNLAGIVEGVFGLDERRVALRRRRHPVQRLPRVHDVSTKIPSSWYRPAELAKHYNFPTDVAGNNQVVGLLEFGGGYFPDDLKLFCQLAGIKIVPTIKTISVDGTPTNATDGAEGEVMLDVEVVAGVCPQSTIVVYFAHWSERGWLSIVDAVIKDKANDPSVISISWGAPEDTDIWTGAGIRQVEESFKEAALLGITICVAAGDDGSSDGHSDGHAHVDFPASSEYVLSVGGTTVPSKGTAQDIVWFEHNGVRPKGGSTGGGVSAVINRPAWQSAVKITSVNPGALVGRCIPDIAANADWDASPYLLVVDGSAQGNGGTSAASPLIASLVALMSEKLGKRVGYLTPRLYQGPHAGSLETIGEAGCTDVISGNNQTAHAGGYSAGKGYDAVSGWGTPNGARLLDALGGPVVSQHSISSGSGVAVKDV